MLLQPLKDLQYLGMVDTNQILVTANVLNKLSGDIPQRFAMRLVVSWFVLDIR